MLVHIGACRPVWVPGQDLATLHLMHNCGTYFVTTLCAICTSVRGAYAGLRACCVSSRLVLVIRVHMLRNNPGNSRVCPGLQAPMFVLLWTRHKIQQAVVLTQHIWIMV